MQQALCENCEQPHEYTPSDRLVVFLAVSTLHHTITLCPCCGHITKTFIQPAQAWKLASGDEDIKIAVALSPSAKVIREHAEAAKLIDARNVFIAEFEPRLTTPDDAA